MDFNPSTYNRYKDTRVSLYPKRSIRDKIADFQWGVLIPLFLLLIFILWILCMQVPHGLA